MVVTEVGSGVLSREALMSRSTNILSRLRCFDISLHVIVIIFIIAMKKRKTESKRENDNCCRILHCTIGQGDQ